MSGYDFSNVSNDELLQMLQSHPDLQPDATPPRTFTEQMGHGFGLAGRNLLQGALSLPTAITNLPGMAYNAGADAIEGQGNGYRFPDRRKLLSDALNEVGFPQPENATERIGGDVEQAMGGVLGGMGAGSALSGAANPATQAVGQALQSGPAMQAASATSGALSGGTARELGASPAVQFGATLAGGAAPSAAVATGRALLNSVTPDQLSPENVRLLNAADRMGVDIRPGQAMGRGALKTADEELSRAPLTGYGEKTSLRISPEVQREQFNRALSNTFGENDDAITGATIGNAHRRLGAVYDTVLPRNSVVAAPNDPVLNDLQSIKADAAALDPGLAAHDRGRVGGAVDYITGLLQQPGGIPGKVYQTLRGQHGLISTLADDEGAIGHLGSKLRTALDDAFARQAQGNDAALLQDANAQYRNLMVVQPLAAKAADGNISPALLQGSVIRHYGAGDAGDIGDLAKIGQLYIKPPPNSGTAERSLVVDLLTNPWEGAKKAIGIPGSSTLGRAANMAINSGHNRNALMGQLLRNPSALSAVPPGAAGIAAALLNHNTGN